MTARLDLEGEDAQVVYIGNDISDKDAFRELQGRGTGIIVRSGEAHAAYALASSRAVQTFLETVSEALSRG